MFEDKVIIEQTYNDLYDKYARRSINWLLYFFLRVFGLVLRGISLSFIAKPLEVLAGISGNSLGAFVALLFYIINRLKLKRQLKQLNSEKLSAFNRELHFAVISSLLYWILASIIHYGFERVFVLDVTDFLTTIYLLGMLVYNICRNKWINATKRRTPYGAVSIILAIVVVGFGYKYLSKDIWLTQPYINSVPNIYQGTSVISYDESNGVYTITKESDTFQILQLTDIHLGGGILSYEKDLKALQSVFTLLEETKPDLVIVTGDLTYPVGLSSFSFNNTAPVQQFAAFMRNTGIPWAFVYGNHDTESIAATSSQSLDELYQSLSYKTSRSLLYPYVQPKITGRNNQVIEIRNQDGSLNQALFLIDSNAYTGTGFSHYDYIHDDQVDWYEQQVLRLCTEEKRTIPSLVFFHIPLQEYRTAYQLYEDGNAQVIYYFGKNEEPANKRICCSECPSKMFDKAKELGSTTGFFCGHDHLNNMSLEYQGIRLTYGMSIDYLATAGIARRTDQRGGTLITLYNDGTSAIRQVPLKTL